MASGSASPTPFASLRNSPATPLACTPNAIQRPSGDQVGSPKATTRRPLTGAGPSAASKVSPSAAPLATLMREMSGPRVTATWVPSGESDGSYCSPGVPTAPRFVPLRSNHCSWVLIEVTACRYTSTPLVEIENAAPGPSSADTGSAIVWAAPVTTNRLGSNGWASRAPRRTNTSAPFR